MSSDSNIYDLKVLMKGVLQQYCGGTPNRNGWENTNISTYGVYRDDQILHMYLQRL